MTPAPKEEILSVPLSSVSFDERWNARSPAAVVAGGDSDVKTGFEGLLYDLDKNGQHDPIDVVATSKDPPKYAAVTGFRRGRALSMLAEGYDPETRKLSRKKNPEATLFVRVRAYGPIEARVRNLTENTQREDLSAADLAYGLSEWWKLDKNVTALEMAHRTGLSQEYIVKLVQVVQKTDPAVFRRWREMPGCPVDLPTMRDIARLPLQEQRRGFEDALARLRVVRPRGRVGHSGAWRQAGRLGGMLGRLVKAHVLVLASESDWSSILQAAIEAGLITHPSDPLELARCMAKAFSQEMETPKKNKRPAEIRNTGS